MSGALGDAEIVNHVYRIENVATQPAERITANDEERQRQGFELQTTFEWAVRDHEIDVRHGAAADAAHATRVPPGLTEERHASVQSLPRPRRSRPGSRWLT